MGLGSIPGWGTEILQVPRGGLNKQTWFSWGPERLQKSATGEVNLILITNTIKPNPGLELVPLTAINNPQCLSRDSLWRRNWD